jgi:hypothetical protein
MRAVPLLLFVVACQDNKVGVYNTPPTVSVLAPADGAQFNPGDLVEFLGAAQDGQDPETDLTISWESSIDGVIGTDPPDGDGNVYLATNALSSGQHIVTLTAVDTDAESASTSLTLDVAPGSVGGAPTVVILGPTDGQAFGASDGVNLIAAVTDGEDAYETLQVEVIDVPDGSMWTGNPASTGSLTVPLTLTPGNHVLTVNATDSDGNTGFAVVSFEVAEDGRPLVAITEPADGASVDLGAPISFRGTVSDDETAVDALGITWTSDRDGVFSTAPSDSSGAVSTSYALSAGIHTITLAATDGMALTGSDAIVLTVEDPLDRDDDRDGYSENEGDCDDGDATLNPGVSDICDEYDNDCSGYVNDPFWDTYEQNETSSTAYDCGEVDNSFGWSNSSLTLSGLTISSDDDEDWFTWEADDEIWDNVTISVSVSGLSSRGTYVVELWDGDGNIVASDSSGSTLTLSHEGELFDDDEDTWSVRVYAVTHASNSCSTAYTITIRS